MGEEDGKPDMINRDPNSLNDGLAVRTTIGLLCLVQTEITHCNRILAVYMYNIAEQEFSVKFVYRNLYTSANSARCLMRNMTILYSSFSKHDN